MFFHTAIQVLEDNLTHIFHNAEYAIVFDPSEFRYVKDALGRELDKSFYYKNEISALKGHKTRKLLYSFITHHHLDHSGGNQEAAEICQNVLIARATRAADGAYGSGVFDEGLIAIKELGMQIECISTPCHTMDSHCFLIKGDEKCYLLTGDTVFYLGVGMFFEGTGAMMGECIFKLKSRVPDEALVLYGHDYRARNIPFVEMHWEVGESVKRRRFLRFEEEKALNPFFNLDRIREGDAGEVMEWLRKEKTKFNS